MKTLRYAWKLKVIYNESDTNHIDVVKDVLGAE